MNAPKAVSDLPKPRLDAYRPLDLFLDEVEGDEDAQTGDEIDVNEQIGKRLLDTSPSGVAAFHYIHSKLPRDVVDRVRHLQPVLMVLKVPNGPRIRGGDAGMRRALEHRMRCLEPTARQALRLIPDGTATSGWPRK